MCRDTSIPAKQLSERIRTLKDINPSSGKTGFLTQFEVEDIF